MRKCSKIFMEDDKERGALMSEKKGRDHGGETRRWQPWRRENEMTLTEGE